MLVAKFHHTCNSKCRKLVFRAFPFTGMFDWEGILRDATQIPGKSPIFSTLKIGGARGVNPDFGKIETKDSNFRDRASVSWEN